MAAPRPRTFRKPLPFVAFAAAVALFCASFGPSPFRDIAADGPVKAPGSQAVEAIGWASEQIDFLTNSMSDMQLYAFGNLLFWGGLTAIIGLAYTWRKTLASPIYRSTRAAQLLPKLEALIQKLEAAGAKDFEKVQRNLRAHIRSIDGGIPFRREILAALASPQSERAVEDLLRVRPEILSALKASPAGNAWLKTYLAQWNLYRAAEAVELNARGVVFDQASTRLVEFFAKAKVPSGLPFQTEFHAIDSPEKFQKWMEHPEVDRFLRTPNRPDIAKWQQDLTGLIEAEDAAFKAMQTHYKELAVDVVRHMEAVDKTGSGVAYMARLIQPQLRFELDRYGFEKFGTFYSLNDGHYSGYGGGRRVSESIIHMDKAVRTAHHAARTEHGTACRQRFEALVMGGLGLTGLAVGWALRGASNRRLERTQGKTGDQIVAEGQARVKAESDAKSKDNVEPPGVAKRLAEARAKEDETEIRELYALMRRTARKPEHLPAIATRIRTSGMVSPDALAVSKFDEKLKAFLEDNEAADAVLDAALAEATHGMASDVGSIKELLFSDDKTKLVFREKAEALLYPSMVKALWPSLVPDSAAFPIDEAIYTQMRKETLPELEGIGGKFRARTTPVPRPPDPPVRQVAPVAASPSPPKS